MSRNSSARKGWLLASKKTRSRPLASFTATQHQFTGMSGSAPTDRSCSTAGMARRLSSPKRRRVSRYSRSGDVLQPEHGHGVGPEALPDDREQVVEARGRHRRLREEEEVELLEALVLRHQVQHRGHVAPVRLAVAEGEAGLRGAEPDRDLGHQAVEVAAQRRSRG